MSILSRVKTWVDQEILEASDLNAEFDAIVDNIIAGTTASVGMVQLEDSHASTSTTKAACPKNVKEAYDLADTMLTKATFDANTFIYAVDDNTPIKKTRTEILALLSGQAGADFALNTHKLTGVVDPTADQEAATKKYVDDTALLDATFNANTFIYSVSDNTPVVKTRAEVMALLSGQAGADFSMGTHKITAVTDPTGDQDAATKKYVDSHFITPGAGTLSAAATAASDGDVLWLKEGVYTETVPIAITSKSLSIIGAGPEVSIIRCTGTHGIVADTNATSKHITLEGFTIETTSSGTYTAIQLEGAVIASNCHKQFYMRNLNIIPYDPANDYWNVGIRLIQGWNTTIDGCHIKGKNNTVSMATGIELSTKAIDVSITNTHLYFMTDGITITAGNEGIMVSNSVFVYVSRGIYAPTSILWLGIFNSHINAFLNGIYCHGIDQSKIVGNLIYKRQDSGSTFVGIQFATSGSHNTITSNTIRGQGTGGVEYGIVLQSGNTKNIVSDNVIDGQDSGIWLKANANYNIVNSNITSNCTNEIVNSGTGNSVTDNLAA